VSAVLIIPSFKNKIQRVKLLVWEFTFKFDTTMTY